MFRCHSTTRVFSISFSSLIVGLFFLMKLPTAGASLPQIDSHPEFRRLVALALAEQASSFTYEVDGKPKSWVLSYGKNYYQVLKSKSPSSLAKLLVRNAKFKLLKKQDGPDNLVSYEDRRGNKTFQYKATVPSIPFSQQFQFSLTVLDPDSLIEDENLPELTKTLKLKLQIASVNLMRRYADEIHLAERMENIARLNTAIETFHSTPPKGDEPHAFRSFLLETQRLKEVEETLNLVDPMARIEYIKENITPGSYQEFPDLWYLRALQSSAIVTPEFSGSEALLASTEESVIHANDEDVLTCTRNGGQVETYSKQNSEVAFLCRFGSAGIGAAALYNFLHGKAVEAIHAFLNHPSYSEQAAAGFSIIVQGTGNQTSLTLQPQQPDRRAGFEFVPRKTVSLQASQYCRQTHGKPIQMESRADGLDFKACIFEDFSGIDAKTLLAGPDAEENAVLVSVLKHATIPAQTEK